MAANDTPLMMQDAAETPEQLAAGLNVAGSPLMAGVKPGSKAALRMTASLPPSAAGAKSRTVPTLQLGTPSAGAPGLMDRINAREAEADKLSGDIADRYSGMQKQYEAAAQNSSALKDLLQSTTQQIQQAQMGPSKWDMLARTSAALSKPTGLGGMAAAFGNAANAGADVHDQQRAAELQRMQMLYQMGVQGNQAQQQTINYGIQGQQAGLQGMQTRLNAANAGADRLTTAYGQQQNAAAAMAAKYDPSLALALALAKTRGDVAGAEGAGGGGDPKLTNAYASYQVAFPSPPARATPAQLAMYNSQLNAILAANPNFQQGNKAIADRVRTNFDINGQQGQKVEFLNNVFAHMGQYDQLMKTLQASGGTTDSPAINSLINSIGKQMGHPEITNLEALQPLLADELVKAMVPNAGTGQEREHQVAQIAANLAPGQWEGKKQTYTQAVGSQMEDLHRQFAGSLHFMPKQMVDEEWQAKLSPEAQQVAAMHSQNAQAVSSQTPVKVKTRAEAMALQPGTHFITPDGRELIR